MSEFILKMDKWDRVENSYIYPRTPNKKQLETYRFSA